MESMVLIYPWRKTMSAATISNKNLREAIRILMLSPFYFKLALADRKVLIREFCALYGNESSS
jgi:hypothetical protein